MVLESKPRPLCVANSPTSQDFYLYPPSTYVHWHWGFLSPSLCYLHSPHNHAIFTWAQIVWDSQCPQGHHYRAFCIHSHLFYKHVYVGSSATPLTARLLRVLKQLVLAPSSSSCQNAGAPIITNFRVNSLSRFLLVWPLSALKLVVDYVGFRRGLERWFSG